MYNNLIMVMHMHVVSTFCFTSEIPLLKLNAPVNIFHGRKGGGGVSTQLDIILWDCLQIRPRTSRPGARDPTSEF